ncbi:MAG: hypothetical protein GY707_09230 [Desulfobacteraceae bacterium]|nr:hypothetical protein [Desulfobacteraceae bacterium]
MSQTFYTTSILTLGVLFLLLVAPFNTSMASEIKDETPSPSLHIIHQRESETVKTILIKYEVSNLQQNEVKIDTITYTSLFIEGCGTYNEVGKPDIPVKSIFLEIPKESDVAVKIKRSNPVILEDVLLLPVQNLPMDSTVKTRLTKNNTIYNGDTPFPSTPIIATKQLHIRDKNLFEIRMSPVQFYPKKKTIKIWNTLNLTLTVTNK